MDLTEKDKEEPTRKRRETRQVLDPDPDPVRIAEKRRRKYDDGILEEDYKNVSLDDPTTATVSDPVTKSSAEYEVKQSGAQLPVLEEARLFTSSDISTLFDGSVSSSLGAMRPLVEKLDILLAPAQEYYRRLPKRIKEGMDLLKDDVEVISYYLDELSEVEDPPPMAMCWMNEARELSYDMEDYIDSLLFVPPDRFNKNKKMKKTKKKKKKMKKLKMKRLKWYKEIACVQPRQVSEHGIETRKLPIPDPPLPNEPKTMEKISKFKQIVCVTQVSKNGTKAIHVNVPRLPNKPRIAETISQFRIYVQEAIERHDRYKLHFCSTLGRRRFLSTGRIVPAPYEEAGPIVIDGRMNEFINSMAANDATDQQPLKVVSILGSGCLGKTTLAKALYNIIGMQFDCRAFIRVSKKPDMKRLFRDLFLQLHQKMQPLPANCNEFGISDNINKHLQNKRYLIVIDDLWDASVWDIINYAFPKGNCGSKIIITTQIEDVALTCCCDHSERVFEMKPLDNDHSRKLFFNRIFGSECDCPEEFKQVSNEIIDICGGLPLATINIASHLANQEIEVSMDLLAYTHDSLRSYLWSNSTSERTRQVLNLSYNNLPRYLKTCLLYLSMYPEGSIIYKDDLVKQWVAEGFIATGKGVEKDQDMMEKEAGICFDELIDRRFIQPIYTNYNNKVVSCTVHDVVHDLIAQKSAEENFIVVVDYNRKNIALSHKVHRLSLIFGDAKYAKTPANIRKSQVRSLRFFGLVKCMPCIREFKILRVLSLQLSGHHGDYDPVELTGISELSQLRYLKIASDSSAKNTVDDAGVSRMCIPYDGLSSVSVAPVHLQTLELSHHCCIFSRLPRCLGELAKLRILKIAVGELLKEDIDILKGLPALTALSLHLPTISAERIVFGKGGFSVLTYLKFMCTVPWVKFEADAMPNLEKLKLCFNALIVDGQRATQIIIEHLSSSIKEISAKICCASVDARSALLKAIRSDPRNPEVQLMGSIYYGHEGRGVVAREGSGEDENNEAHSRSAMALGAFKAIASVFADINACREFFSWATPGIVAARHQLLAQDGTAAQHQIHEVREQLRQLENDLWKLHITMAPKMLDLIDRVEWQSHKKPAADLLPDIKDAVYDAEDLLDEFNYYAIKLGVEQSKNSGQDHMEGAFLRFYNSIKEDCDHFNKVKEIQGKLDHIYEQSRDLGWHQAPQKFDRSIRPGTCSFPNKPQIFGREKELKQLVQKLGVRARKRRRTDGEETMTELPVLPIVGMGGVGKTTMAQQICNDAKVKAHFDCRIWTCVSNDFDIKRLTREILQHLGQQTPSDNLNILLTNLASRVKSKKFLLVLDDMWDDILKEGGAAWKRFCKPLENGLQGSMILVTTRSSEVANLVGTMNHYDLAGLPDDVFWEFFKLCAFGSSGPSNYPELECIGKVILQKLKGSPLAAKTLGCLLRRGLNTTHWKYILESELWQLKKDATDILPALRLSYMYLPPHLKRCFSICAMYPKDHVFEKEVLVNIWIAQGCAQPQDASFCFADLENRSFFQRVHRRSDKFVIHDLIHDTAQLVSKDECFVIKHASDLHEIPSNVRHLSIFTNENVGFSELKSICNKKKLRSLVCNEYYSNPTMFAPVIDSWFRELLKIRVLSFKLSRVTRLPESMGNSKHLRYLCLFGRSTSLSTLPSSIRCLHHLKIIEARECEFESFPQGFSDVISLQKIGLDYNKDHSDRPCLKWTPTYRISGEKQVQMMEELPHWNLQHLEREHYGGGSCPSWLRSNLLPRLRSLKFDYCLNIQSISFFEPLCREEVSDNLHRLEELRIERCSSLTSIGVSEASSSSSSSVGAFSSLARITILQCGGLLSLDEFLTPAYLPAVKDIRIESCQELTSLPVDRLHGFSCLEKVTIEDCRKLGTQRVMILPSSLKYLWLERCGGIETIDFRQLRSSPALERLHIYNCPDLRSIGGSVTVGQIKIVDISDCPQLTEIEQPFLQVIGHWGRTC